MFSLQLLSCLSFFLVNVRADVTVYGQQGVLATSQIGQTTYSTDTTFPTAVNNAFPANYTDAAAYNPVVLAPPALPTPLPPSQFNVQLAAAADNLFDVPGQVNALSIEHVSDFLGFSIEMSVVDQVIGLNGSIIFPPFLNLMSVVAERSGSVRVRVGGNTQDYAVVVDSLPDGKAIEKDKTDSTNPTDTPTVYITPEYIYILSNVSSMVNVNWYLGIPFNDTNNLRLQIAEVAESILGDRLLGLQAGNEPDLYATHGHRPANYSQYDYLGEVEVVIEKMGADSLIPVKNNLIVPSVSGTWSPESVWNTGIVSICGESLIGLAVEHYPDNNCAAAFPSAGFGPARNPQDVFPEYLNHGNPVGNVQTYLNSSLFSQQNNKPFLMFETNSASCGGFPGVSDSFGISLWMADYAMQMAYGNFSAAMLHVGGIDDTYNPFMPPPTNESLTNQWTVTPIFYSTLVTAEALGTSNSARVVDLNLDGDQSLTPGYAIYENGALARVMLINYMTDPTGAAAYTATISVGGTATGEANSVPSSVSVKYLLAPSVGEKFNVSWAGQTFGSRYQSDGRLQGDIAVETVDCDQTANTCSITVPAPGLALVFFSQTALEESSPTTTQTFSTTSVTKLVNTATVAQSVLATSNGENAAGRQELGSTSQGSASGALALTVPALSVFAAFAIGAAVLARSL